jgi:type IV secretory pathway TraG/TraD family ATPase VirD4
LEYLKGEHLITNSQAFADLLCPVNPHDSAEARHFQGQAALVLQCLCLYVMSNPDIQRNDLGSVYDFLCQAPQDFMQQLKEMAKETALLDGIIAGLANRILGIHVEELSGILTTACDAVKFVNIPEVRQAVSKSEILLADIINGGMDLFVCIPLKHLPTQQKLLRLITGITFMVIQDAQGKIKQNVLMLLEEMPALGYMKKDVHPNTWDSFFSNQLSVFFGCNEPMTAEFIAKKIGKMTIKTASISQSMGTQTNSKHTDCSSLQSSHSVAETGREVLMPDEIQRLGNNVVLAFYGGKALILCSRINYWERVEWAGQWDINPLYENKDGFKLQYSLQDYVKIAFKILTA